MSKWSSRKFIISVAAFLGSLGMGITGLATDNKTVAIAGVVCTILSQAIYAAAEAYVDGKDRENSSDILIEGDADDEAEFL